MILSVVHTLNLASYETAMVPVSVLMVDTYDDQQEFVLGRRSVLITVPDTSCVGILSSAALMVSGLSAIVCDC